ncbi:copper homeostasis membrane protein CopD [Proteus vulgaris]|uniref:Copper resistance protein D n=1 Tax=Proteus vulgaris TaxID=585 RepID=A0A6G6SIZ2_PROVU|nr:copper homeostasis membrane protein CopD [Proteus vulgaris]QIF93791.1 copper homeostasis membrane protein CopD [Proteus vulgaris]WIF73738.1 copper homeostasis membrane protein CopD [Proteus vulgaris]CRL64816.1 Inner membrane protein YebZ [Proteus vulgaris]
MTPEDVYILCRFFHFVAVMFMFGLSFSAAILAKDKFIPLIQVRLRPALAISTITVFITTYLWMAVQSGIMGDGWEDAWSFEIWKAVLGTSFGQIWQWQLILATLALAALFIHQRYIRNFSLLIIASIMLILHASIGHGAMFTGSEATLYKVNQSIHLISAAYWFGGLWPFVACLQFLRNKDELAEGMIKPIIGTMKRFSLFGHVAVLLVTITGIISAVMLIPGWPAIHLSSEYQSMLWLKISLVVLMLGLAVINRYVLVPHIRKKNNFQWLLINSWFELLLGTMVIFTVAIFAINSPV